jgi:opacity protein-like surface antigen
MMPRFSLVVVCGAMLASNGITIASAADMLPPPPVIYAPVPQQFSWSGFYIGGNAGYGWTRASGTITTMTGAGSFSLSGNGFLGGAQAGYNWQAESIVFGVEADFQGTTASGSVNAAAGPTINGTINTGSARYVDGLATQPIACCSTPPAVACMVIAA